MKGPEPKSPYNDDYDIENQYPKELENRGTPGAPDDEQSSVYDSFGEKNPRKFGAAKMLVSGTYLFAVANPPALLGLAVLGAGGIVGGRLMRTFGWMIGSKTLMDIGARIADIGVKVAFSPVYAAAVGLDGLYGGVTGQDVSIADGLIGKVNSATNWISGMNSVKAEREALEQDANNNQTKSISQADKDKTRADERQKVMQEEMAKNPQQLQNNNIPPMGTGQQTPYPTPRGYYPPQQEGYPGGYSPPQQGYPGASQPPMQEWSQQNYPNYNDYGVHPIEDIATANSLQEAQGKYGEFLNQNRQNQFRQLSIEQQHDGGCKVVWQHPHNPDQQVACYYDKEGRCTGAEPVGKAKTNAILPPIYTSNNDKGFKCQEVKNGTIEDYVPEKAPGKNLNPRNALKHPSSGAVVTATPPVKIKGGEQSRSVK